MRTYIVYLFGIMMMMAGSCSVQRLQVTERKSNFELIDHQQAVDTPMNQWLLSYRKGMDSSMNIVIGRSSVPLSKAKPECTLGNFMADAQLEKALQYNPHTQVSVLNYGGIRIPYLSPGEITRGKLFELMPFDNKLVIMELPGKVLLELCNHIAAAGGWPVAGLQFQIKNKSAIGVLVAGNPLNEQVIYTVALSDYLAQGGDRCDFLIGNRHRDYNVFIRDLLIDYILELKNQGKTLAPQLENRISYAE